MSGVPDSLQLPAPLLAARVREGEVRAAEIAEASLSRIERENPRLGALLHVPSEKARRDARAVDARVAAGEDPGPLAGVPLVIKDNIVTAGIPTTAASRILQGHEPLYDATVVARLRNAGGVVVGKANLDEFGMGSSTENSGYIPARNPWNPQRVPGGSSGGSAASVAAGLAVLALGSDTGGSVRQPAAFCGVYGLLPTYGRVSRYGLIAFASSLDQIGPLARDVDGLELLFRVIAGADSRDSTSRGDPTPPAEPRAGVRGLRVGFAASLLDRSGVEPAVSRAVGEAARSLERDGAILRQVELPDPDLAVATYYLLATAEASSNLARYDGVRYGIRVPGEELEAMIRRTRHAGFGPEVKRRILLGTYVLSAGYYDAYYLQAQESRTRIRRAFHALFESVDLVLLPTSPTVAFPLGERVLDPVSMYLADVFTVYANLAGLPALSVPAGRDADGLPLGVQLLASPWREDRLFRAARALRGLGGDEWPSSETAP